jgi:YD repeat-containing protein
VPPYGASAGRAARARARGARFPSLRRGSGRTVPEHRAFVSDRTDGDGHDWQVRYDEAGRPVERTAPDGRTWQRDYDPAGAVVAETDSAGATTRYEYDPRGRVVAVIDVAGGRPAGRRAAGSPRSPRRSATG